LVELNERFLMFYFEKFWEVIKIISIRLFILFTLLLFAIKLNASNSYKLNEDKIWKMLIEPYLMDSLWNDEYKYDAAYDLMVLLHDAFQRRDMDRIEGFKTHFNNFIEKSGSFKGENRTHDLQYMYFSSQFIVLSCESELNYDLSFKLYNLLKKEIEFIWLNERFRVSNTDKKKYFYHDGLKDRLEWKIYDTIDRKIAPFKAIIDIENFTFAIAADLNYVNKKYRFSKESQLFESILSLANIVYSNRITYVNDSIWYSQNGYRDESSDYMYAGYKNKDDIKQPRIVENIASDVNHFQRMPLWLLSLMKGDTINTLYYKKLHDDLETLFLHNIIVKPNHRFPYVRVNNFVDGNNGLYRWNYNTLKKNEGYGPYELSYSFLHGWYSFINKRTIQEIFILVNKQFPIDENHKYIYQDKTQRKQHEVIRNGLDNGLYWLISNAASRIN
jgi:hypothetical protein